MVTSGSVVVQFLSDSSAKVIALHPCKVQNTDKSIGKLHLCHWAVRQVVVHLVFAESFQRLGYFGMNESYYRPIFARSVMSARLFRFIMAMLG